MFFKYFSRQILFSRTFQDSPVYSSTFQACANSVHCKFRDFLENFTFQLALEDIFATFKIRNLDMGVVLDCIDF